MFLQYMWSIIPYIQLICVVLCLWNYQNLTQHLNKDANNKYGNKITVLEADIEN